MLGIDKAHVILLSDTRAGAVLLPRKPALQFVVEGFASISNPSFSVSVFLTSRMVFLCLSCFYKSSLDVANRFSRNLGGLFSSVPDLSVSRYLTPAFGQSEGIWSPLAQAKLLPFGYYTFVAASRSLAY
jgi:hypothetical protein